MVDLRMLREELEIARRARRAAEMAGFDLEHVISRMQAGRSLLQIELEQQAAYEADVPAFRKAA